MKWFLRISLAMSLKWVEYLFNRDYGELFFDYSLNSRYGSNGGSNPETKVTSTDRGIYFKSSQSFVTINPVGSFPSTFTASSWLLSEDSATGIFHYIDSTFSFMGGRGNYSDLIRFYYMSNPTFGNADCFKPYLWVLFSLIYSQGIFKGSINGNVCVTVNLDFSPKPSYMTGLGDYLGLGSLQFILWNFVMWDQAVDVQDLVDFTGSGNCLLGVGSCVSCLVAFKDVYLGIGCLDLSTNPTLNSFGIICSTYGCTKTVTLNCPESTSFCTYDQTSNTCFKKALSDNLSQSPSMKYECLCVSEFNNRGGQCCKSTCKSCNYLGDCIECYASNSYFLDGECFCNLGYYSSGNFSNEQNCVICELGCSKCSSDLCQSCSDLNAFISGKFCICNQGYFGSPDLCIKCPEGCDKCTALDSCTKCSNQNSIVISGICMCTTGYFGDGISCTKCHKTCYSCNSSGICETCLLLNTVIKDVSCLCKTGFYGDAEIFCNKCQDLCEICTDLNTCIKCLDSNSDINGGNCICKTGYFIEGFVCNRCESKCLECTGLSDCIECVDENAEVVNGICQCSDGFYWDANIEICTLCGFGCFKCSVIGCLECLDTYSIPNENTCKCNEGYFQMNNSYECSQCQLGCINCNSTNCLQCMNSNKTDLDGHCIDICPLGYIENQNHCQISSQDNSIVLFDFQSVSRYFIDKKSSLIGTIKSNSLNNSLEIQDYISIYSSYQRGAFFEGSGFIDVDIKDLRLLSHSFVFSVWFMPNTENGIIFDKKMNKTEDLNEDFFSYLMLSFDQMNPETNFGFANESFKISSHEKIGLNKWNHIILGFDTYSSFDITLIVNKVKTVATFNFSMFIDSTISTFTIGGVADGKNAFSGFMYSLEIFSNSEIISDLIFESNCSNCDLCNELGSCIPICDISEYFDEISGACYNCPSNCTKSCKNSTTCNLCFDEKCISCINLNPQSCLECDENYQLTNNSCEKCPQSSYYELISKQCKACPNLCKSCQNNLNCHECKENSSIVKGICECIQGYREENECIRNYFFANSWISKGNTINLIFSESLSHDLTKTYLNVSIDGKETSYKLHKYDSKNYEITAEILNDYSNFIEINILKPITSIDNSLLNTTFFEHELYKSQYLETQAAIAKKAEKAKKLGKNASLAGVSVSLAVSLLNFDISSLFDFLNTAEIFYSAYLFNINLNPILNEFLMSIRLQKSFPNLATYIISSDHNLNVSKKLKKFGYKSHICIINIGIQLTTLSILGIILLTTHLLKKIKKLASLCKSIQESLIFGGLLRFWLQTSYEVLLASSTSLSHFNTQSISKIIDISSSIILITLEFIMTVIMISILIKRQNLKQLELIEQYNKKFSFLFLQFKQEGLKSSMFYVLFILKRVVLICSLNFINDGVLQLSLITGVSIWTCLYIGYSKCFKNKVEFFSNLLNEAAMAGFWSVLLINFIFDGMFESEKISDVCIYMVMTSWVLNAVIRVFIMIRDIFVKVKTWMGRNNKVAEISEQTQVKNMITEKKI